MLVTIIIFMQIMKIRDGARVKALDHMNKLTVLPKTHSSVW